MNCGGNKSKRKKNRSDEEALTSAQPAVASTYVIPTVKISRLLRPRDPSPPAAAAAAVASDDDDVTPSKRKKSKNPPDVVADRKQVKAAFQKQYGKTMGEWRTRRNGQYTKAQRQTPEYRHFVGRVSRGLISANNVFFAETKLEDIPERKECNKTYQRIYFWGDGMGTCREN